MRALSFVSFLAFSAAAMACPSLKEVKPQIQDVHQRLKAKSLIPLKFEDGFYLVKNHPKDQGAVFDFLKGNFEGYTIHRLKSHESGVCVYKLTDDKTPAVAYFILEKANMQAK